MLRARRIDRDRHANATVSWRPGAEHGNNARRSSTPQLALTRNPRLGRDHSARDRPASRARRLPSRRFAFPPPAEHHPTHSRLAFGFRRLADKTAPDYDIAPAFPATRL